MSILFPSPLSRSTHAPWPGARWRAAGQEPALDEVLADPLVHAVMQRDGVTPSALRAVVAAAQAKLRRGLCCRCAA